MTDFLNSNGLNDTVTEATLKYYGEYPPGSGKYYAYPTEGDANGWAYRKDIVEDPEGAGSLQGQVRVRLLDPAEGLQGIRRHVEVLLPA